VRVLEGIGTGKREEKQEKSERIKKIKKDE
jgi:hypothetical protein